MFDRGNTVVRQLTALMHVAPLTTCTFKFSRALAACYTDLTSPSFPLRMILEAIHTCHGPRLGTLACMERVCYQTSLAASHSPPSRSSGRAAKPCVEGGEGLANIALDCISTDQSDLTEAIRSNFIHDSRGCKPSRSRSISLAESV